MFSDDAIDSESNARPGSEIHDRAEFAKSKFKVEATKTVSLDTNVFSEIPPLSCQMAWCVLLGPRPHITLPSPPPP